MGRKQIQHIVEEHWFTRLVIAIIIVNALVLGLETSKPIMAKWGDILHAAKQCCPVINFKLDFLFD